VYLALYGPEGLVIFDHPYNEWSVRVDQGLLGCSQAVTGWRG
jgi:hypothetical protein